LSRIVTFMIMSMLNILKWILTNWHRFLSSVIKRRTILDRNLFFNYKIQLFIEAFLFLISVNYEIKTCLIKVKFQCVVNETRPFLLLLLLFFLLHFEFHISKIYFFFSSLSIETFRLLLLAQDYYCFNTLRLKVLLFCNVCMFMLMRR